MIILFNSKLVFEGACEGVPTVIPTLTRVVADKIQAYHDVREDDEDYPTLLDLTGGGSYYVSASIDQMDKIMEEWCVRRTWKIIDAT